MGGVGCILETFVKMISDLSCVMRDLGTVDVCVAVAVAWVLIVMVGGAPATTQHATVAAPEHIEHIGGYPGGHVRLRRL